MPWRLDSVSLDCSFSILGPSFSMEVLSLFVLVILTSATDADDTPSARLSLSRDPQYRYDGRYCDTHDIRSFHDSTQGISRETNLLNTSPYARALVSSRIVPIFILPALSQVLPRACSRTRSGPLKNDCDSRLVVISGKSRGSQGTMLV